MLSIIIPDLHGDFDEFCNILFKYGIIKSLASTYIKYLILSNNLKNELNMKNKRLIQLGDILDSQDRKPRNQYTIKYNDMLLFTFVCKIKRAFRSQVYLIMGNHELLNCRRIFEYVSPFSTRNSREYLNILNNVLDLFEYYFIDENHNLYIHSCIPDQVSSRADLESINKYIKNNINKMSNQQFSAFYNDIFTRKYANRNSLSRVRANRVFFGHTPHSNVFVIDDCIFYVDTMISKAFASMLNTYECIHIDSIGNKVYIDKIYRRIKY